MPKINRHIEIVRSSLNGMSSMSMPSSRAVQRVLAKHYTTVGITVINDTTDLERLVEAKPDLVFMGMKYLPQNPSLGRQDPDKIWLSSYFDSVGIIHTGSARAAIEFESNKPQAKQQVADTGLATAQYFTA